MAMAMIARRTYSRFQPDFKAAARRLSMEGSRAKRQAARYLACDASSEGGGFMAAFNFLLRPFIRSNRDEL